MILGFLMCVLWSTLSWPIQANRSHKILRCVYEIKFITNCLSKAACYDVWHCRVVALWPSHQTVSCEMKITVMEKSDLVPLHYPTWYRAKINSVSFSRQCSLSGANICIWVSWSSDQGAFPCASSFSVRKSNSSQRIPFLLQWLMLLVCKRFRWSGSLR